MACNKGLDRLIYWGRSNKVMVISKKCIQQWILWVENIMSSAIGQHNYVPWSHCVRMCRNVSWKALLRGQTPVRLSGLRMEETFKQWSKTPAGLCVSTWIRAGNLCRNPGGGGKFFFWILYQPHCIFVFPEFRCIFEGELLTPLMKLLKHQVFIFGWLIEWQTNKTQVETVDFQHLHMNWWVLFISNSHVMPTDLWFMWCFTLGAEWKVGILQASNVGKIWGLEPQRLDVYTYRRCCCREWKAEKLRWLATWLQKMSGELWWKIMPSFFVKRHMSSYTATRIIWSVDWTSFKYVHWIHDSKKFLASCAWVCLCTFQLAMQHVR